MTDTKAIGRPDPAVIAALRQAGPGPVGDALQRLGIRDCVMSAELRPIFCPGPICGPAVTLKQIPTRGRKGVSKHIDVLYEAQAGDVVVFDTFGRYDVIMFGGRAALVGKQRQLEAAVVDGAVRDSAEIEASGLPTFARSVPVSTPRVGEVLETQAINVPIACGGALVNPGDLIVGDRDGLVVVPADRADAVAALARQLDEDDKRQLEAIRAGLPKEQWYR